MPCKHQTTYKNFKQCISSWYKTKYQLIKKFVYHKNSQHALATLAHMVEQFISLCLMLTFMTFNMYLIMSVILSIGVSYFLIGWKAILLGNKNTENQVNNTGPRNPSLQNVLLRKGSASCHWCQYSSIKNNYVCNFHFMRHHYSLWSINYDLSIANYLVSVLVLCPSSYSGA